MSKTASKDDVLQWLKQDLFTIYGDRVYKGDRELAQRLNKRRRSDRGDPRVDLYAHGKRRSMQVSHLVWMSATGLVIQDGWEVHHLDGDPLNNAFENLLVVHHLDHQKMHLVEEEVPF